MRGVAANLNPEFHERSKDPTMLEGWSPGWNWSPYSSHWMPLMLVSAPRRLRIRSANLNRLTVPRCRLITYGCRGFLSRWSDRWT